MNKHNKWQCKCGSQFMHDNTEDWSEQFCPTCYRAIVFKYDLFQEELNNLFIKYNCVINVHAEFIAHLVDNETKLTIPVRGDCDIDLNLE